MKDCNSRTRARLGCSRSWRMPTVWFPSEALRISTAHSRPSWQMSSLSLKPPLAALASLAASVLVLVSFQFLLMCFLFGIILELKFMDIEKKYLNFNCRKQKRASFASHDHRPRFFFNLCIFLYLFLLGISVLWFFCLLFWLIELLFSLKMKNSSTWGTVYLIMLLFSALKRDYLLLETVLLAMIMLLLHTRILTEYFFRLYPKFVFWLFRV